LCFTGTNFFPLELDPRARPIVRNGRESLKHKVLFARRGKGTDAYAHRVLAIVPFKGLDGAKTRLAAALSDDERAVLVREMLARVLVACEGAASIRRTLLVTPAPGDAPAGIDALVDAGTGHADAVALALADPRAQQGALVVMSDCPLVEPSSLDALVDAARPLALVPAHDGGVNALALRDPELFPPRFGRPATEMVAAARAAGIEPALVEDQRLALDVDRPEDYEAALAHR
jgi:2-phospho-L-lactate guanylyltransferase